jgi:methyltransferase (TIGR00027 family)
MRPVPTADAPALRNISDTARWVAVYRAQETRRADALFRDPLAAKLAGPRGEEIAKGFSFGQRHAWSFVARTVLIDRFIRQEVRGGVDLVVNLAAGLDTRPYRMALPPELRWVEVDLPELLDYKEEVLRDDKPVCQLERVRLDLADMPARRELFARLGSQSKKALVLAEGLLIYLPTEQVGALAADLAAPPSFQRLVIDLVSPGLLKILQEGMGQQLNAAGAPLVFGPEEGTDYFQRYGWKLIEAKSMLKTAGQLGRLHFRMWLVSLLPEAKVRHGRRPWSGICLFGRG